LSSKHKNRGASRADTASHGLPGGIFAAGLLTGIVLTLAVSAILPDRAPAIDAETAEGETPEPQQNSEFQFYTLLNEQEVVVSDNSASTVPETEETVYGLQVASFRNLEDADALRAQLILLNLNVEISTVNNQGMLWHRVMVGPFRSRTERASAMDTLINNNHRPLLIEWKQQLPTTNP
jgi:cell division protein FtsN